jgi:PhnB protein
MAFSFADFREGDAMRVQSYLLFDGRCEEAIAFYRRVFGAEVEMLMRFKDSPESCDQLPPGSENKVMHAQIRIGETRLLMSDGQCMGKPNFQGFSLAASVSGEAEAEKLFSDLSEGGQVQMPLAKTFFSPRFGMVADRFGVSWMILVAA